MPCEVSDHTVDDGTVHHVYSTVTSTVVVRAQVVVNPLPPLL